jgi:DNA replication protein DnaC
MIRNDKKYTTHECGKCTPTQMCEEGTIKTKASWLREIPDRYTNANIDSMVSLSSQNKETLDKFITTIVGRNHKTNTGLFIYGELGTGKTWLLYGLAKKLSDKSSTKVSYFPPFHVEDCKSLVFKFHQRYTGRGDNSIDEYVKEFVDLSRNTVVILDDLGHGNTTKDDFAMNIYNLLIDAIYVNMGFIAVSSNHDPIKLKDYIGTYAVDRVMEMCGNNLIKITGDSQRI